MERELPTPLMDVEVYFYQISDGVKECTGATFKGVDPVRIGREGFWVTGAPRGDYYVAPAAIVGMYRLDAATPPELIEEVQQEEAREREHQQPAA